MVPRARWHPCRSHGTRLTSPRAARQPGDTLPFTAQGQPSRRSRFGRGTWTQATRAGPGATARAVPGLCGRRFQALPSAQRREKQASRPAGLPGWHFSLAAALSQPLNWQGLCAGSWGSPSVPALGSPCPGPPSSTGPPAAGCSWEGAGGSQAQWQGGQRDPGGAVQRWKMPKLCWSLKPAGQKGLFGWGLGSRGCERPSHRQSTAGFHLVGFRKSCLPGSVSPPAAGTVCLLGKRWASLSVLRGSRTLKHSRRIFYDGKLPRCQPGALRGGLLGGDGPTAVGPALGQRPSGKAQEKQEGGLEPAPCLSPAKKRSGSWGSAACLGRAQRCGEEDVGVHLHLGAGWGSPAPGSQHPAITSLLSVAVSEGPGGWLGWPRPRWHLLARVVLAAIGRASAAFPRWARAMPGAAARGLLSHPAGAFTCPLPPSPLKAGSLWRHRSYQGGSFSVFRIFSKHHPCPGTLLPLAPRSPGPAPPRLLLQPVHPCEKPCVKWQPGDSGLPRVAFCAAQVLGQRTSASTWRKGIQLREEKGAVNHSASSWERVNLTVPTAWNRSAPKQKTASVSIHRSQTGVVPRGCLWLGGARRG